MRLWKSSVAAHALGAAIVATVAAQDQASRQQSSARRTLVIVHAEHLATVAAEWAQYRGTSAGGAHHTVLHAAAQRESIQAFIRQAHRDAAPQNPEDFAVLLLGDANPDETGQGIPTWRFPQRDPSLQSRHDQEYATDHPYQLMDDADDVPDIALGRVPAHTIDEARACLNKIKRYEASAASWAGVRPMKSVGRWPVGRNRITYVAGEGHFGLMDSLLESMFKTMVDQMVPDAYDLSMTYAKATSIYCPPPSKLTDTVMERMGEGAVLFNYLGHGFEKGLDSLHWNGKRYPIMRAADFKRLPERAGGGSGEHVGGQMPIAFMSCCSVGWFDLPNGERSFAEEMLLHPTGGCAAVIAGSRITHPYANIVLEMDITRTLLGPKEKLNGDRRHLNPLTVGMLDLLSAQSLVTIDQADRELDALAAPIAIAGKWRTSLPGLRKMHVRLYNLLGDPAMRIAKPAAAISELTLEGPRVRGNIEGMKSGRVHVVIETPRASFVNVHQIEAVIDENDPELERKAANNYPLVNDRVLARCEGEVRDGRFEVLIDDLPPGAALLRAFAIGVSGSGAAIDAVGALRLPSPQIKD